MIKVFDSNATKLNHVDVPSELKKGYNKEPMFLKSTKDFVMQHGGATTRFLLDNLPDDWKDSEIAIDTRYHMLMKGMFPCIPAFHHDYVERSRADGQPNYENPSYDSEHLLFLIGADVSSTRFAIGVGEYTDVPLGDKVYNAWHHETIAHLDNGVMYDYNVPDCTWVRFDDHSFHEGTKAPRNGWRYFMRVSRFTEHGKVTPISPPKIHNAIRTQVQVYLDDYSIGW